MIPNPSWFPTNLQDRAAWLNNFTIQITPIGSTLGLSGADIISIGHDNDVVQFLAETDPQVNAYIDAIRSYRRTITEGNIGDQTPIFPADVTFTLPSAIATGVFERLDNIVKRIRAAPAYTPEIGALLGIIPSGSGGPSIPVGDVPPVLKPSVDPGHVIEVKFTRGNSDGIYLEKNVNNAGWTFVDKFIKSPCVFTVPGDGIPQGVQLRARFLDNNTTVGDWSDIVTVQTIP